VKKNGPASISEANIGRVGTQQEGRWGGEGRREKEG